MYAITGITGKVGGALAQTLLSANQPVRAVVRNPGRAQAWAERGCEVAAANFDDAASLAAAFEGAAGVFILPPSNSIRCQVFRRRAPSSTPSGQRSNHRIPARSSVFRR